MSVFDEFKESNAWDKRYDLPLCPQANNPWIYGAYCLKVMRQAGLNAVNELTLLDRFDRHADACRIEPGLFNRGPDGGGGTTSFDEVMGLAYISPKLAKEIVAYLTKTDGIYLNKPEEKKTNPKWEIDYNLYRFVFMSPFLRARAGYKLNLMSQASFALHLLNDIRVTDKDTDDAGGRLRIWLMLETMQKAGPVAGAACWYWKKKMNELGFSPKNQLAVEPKENPVLAKFAKDKFE